MIKNLLRQNNFYHILLALFFVSGTLVSCKKDAPPVPPATPAADKPVDSAVKPVQKPVSSAQQTVLASGNQFDFSNKKDPFKPFVAPKPVDIPVVQKENLQEGLPINQYDVSQFKLIGVVTGVGDNKAMVVAPNGKGYVLKHGMSIGKNNGKVTSITAAGVSVTEQFKDDSDRVRREVIKITLPKKL